MSRRRTKIPAPSWEHDQGNLSRRLEASRWQLWITGIVIILVIAALGVIGWGFLSDYIEDQQRPGSLGLRVADRELSVREYTRRAELFVDQNGQTSAFLVLPTLNNQLVEEALLLQFASERDVSATDEEVTLELASMLGLAADDPNFDARIQEEFESSGISEEEYRDIARASVLREKMLSSFEEEVPDTLPSVHYRQIELADQSTADDLVEQLDEGADFATLATENSIDPAAADNGGDQGFVPEGYLDDAREGIIFNMEPGEVTTYPTADSVFIFEVIETSDIQEPTDEQRTTLGVNAYQDWLEARREEHEIVNEFDFENGDPDKITYVVEHANLTLG